MVICGLEDWLGAYIKIPNNKDASKKDALCAEVKEVNAMRKM